MRAASAGDGDVSTTMLGDWFATGLFWKPQVALLVNERTLLPVYMPLAPAATLLDRVPPAIATVLRLHGVDDTTIASELAAMGDTRMAPTNNRSVVGVMNEFAFHGEGVFEASRIDLEQLSLRMSQMIVGPLMKGTGSPDRELAAVLAASGPAQLPSNVILFPGSYRPDSAPVTVSEPPPERSIFQLKITLQNIKPLVWRRVLVDAGSYLSDVHEVIQAAFGWWNHHLYDFEVDAKRYGVSDPNDDWSTPAIDEGFIRLDSIATVGSTIDYTYDFGDGWNHEVIVEKRFPATSGTSVPVCVGGRRACPPEDCGGPWGYQELLDILADPAHPEHQERTKWLDRPFDPDAFDPADFTRNLRMIHRPTFDD